MRCPIVLDFVVTVLRSQKSKQKSSTHTNYSFTARLSETGASVESTAFKKVPFSVIGAGYYNGYSGGMDAREGNGHYWTLHADVANPVINLSFDRSNFDWSHGDNKIYGFTVRCVVR